jgi:hypothetical protein
MKNNTKQTALDAYLQKNARIAEMIERLKSASDDHFYNDPDNINWNHVGDLGMIETSLQELNDRVFHEGEYAHEAGRNAIR